MDSYEKTLKQEGKTLSDIDDLLVKALDSDEEFEKLEKSKWVRVDVVLEILEGERQELADLVKNWPYVRKSQMPTFISHGTFNRLKEAIETYEDWFTNFQKKFGEMEKEG